MTKGVGPSIGIDLGMTYSCVGVWQHVDIMGNDQATMATAPRPPTSPPPATPPGTRFATIEYWRSCVIEISLALILARTTHGLLALNIYCIEISVMSHLTFSVILT
ncbi:hypothetical protein VPH35_095069 [Triticum aestivum]|uniref:Uncharacterized protein n=1 Tax=Aegilops tauschii subsp. strangulata TaxID=200361 RepID=A0A453JI00_AEGTS